MLIIQHRLRATGPRTANNLSKLMETMFTLLNTLALSGWSFVLAIVLSQSLFTSQSEWTAPFFKASPSSPLPSSGTVFLIDVLTILEGICFIEVARIALGQLKGNLVLGVVLHIIRMTCLLLVLPQGLESRDGLCLAVLLSWALTEVCRYPMYIFPTSSVARYVRLVLPLATFPLGAFAEGLGAYRALMKLWGSSNYVDILHWSKVFLLGMVVLVNSILGPTMAYPALLKKGLPVLLGKGSDSITQKKKTA